MLSSWTWRGMTVSTLIAGLPRSALIPSLPWPTSFSILSLVSGLALVPGLPRLACISSCAWLSRLSRRSRWSLRRRRRRGDSAAGKRQH